MQMGQQPVEPSLGTRCTGSSFAARSSCSFAARSSSENAEFKSSQLESLEKTDSLLAGRLKHHISPSQ
eukprot:CAMPEP_0174292236 /NCGR_PEP_ID=MMETSP0809-20121228/34748_1 /TAXON_ID=73025 ORGANISM="Eutreptiella gymnastica-like, Strain CCMP1594" /NCGR_SAMPLE_ID=MMETSP0809 /ASSEMBLY_ACC=CAM_ASM_000658 /LENGTH=67 /DNA_ID=CAMNT_0015392167 /DNA_START=522 /DNA_END=725 /DNA_ORIENTATION=-